MQKAVAILIVNGGKEPNPSRWLELHLRQIERYTVWSNYHIYVWNNKVSDSWATKFVDSFTNTTLTTADSDEVFKHPHAEPLQRLYEMACADEAAYIVTMDSDAFPIRQGWLTELVEAVDRGAVLAGVWQDEMSEGIRPYVNPSCLCTTPHFIEENKLRFDFITPKDGAAKHDTSSSFIDKVLELDLKVYRLRRSNYNELHFLMGRGLWGHDLSSRGQLKTVFAFKGRSP